MSNRVRVRVLQRQRERRARPTRRRQRCAPARTLMAHLGVSRPQVSTVQFLLDSIHSSRPPGNAPQPNCITRSQKKVPRLPRHLPCSPPPPPRLNRHPQQRCQLQQGSKAPHKCTSKRPRQAKSVPWPLLAVERHRQSGSLTTAESAAETKRRALATLPRFPAIHLS